jgi:hypothetical protein
LKEWWLTMPRSDITQDHMGDSVRAFAVLAPEPMGSVHHFDRVLDGLAIMLGAFIALFSVPMMAVLLLATFTGVAAVLIQSLLCLSSAESRTKQEECQLLFRSRSLAV